MENESIMLKDCNGRVLHVGDWIQYKKDEPRHIIDIMSVENFLDIMLVESSNKSAYALAEKMKEPVFVNLMNQKAKEIGLQNTFFAKRTITFFISINNLLFLVCHS